MVKVTQKTAYSSQGSRTLAAKGRLCENLSPREILRLHLQRREQNVETAGLLQPEFPAA